MIETWMADLPHGIRLSCRGTGQRGRPLLLFLHGFPEGAFVWDALMAHFAQPENGGFRCVAPNLRGFERSSAPAAVADYRPEHLLRDVMALAQLEHPQGQAHSLIGHDWGGAIAWAAAHAAPECIQRLIIVNAPHPATFARELQTNPAQQQASAYMHFLARPDAEALLAEDDYRRLWPFFTNMGAGADGLGWLTEAVRDRYRQVWDRGLTGACNLYRVTPLKPPPPDAPHAPVPQPPPGRVRVTQPTLVLWALEDTALLPQLLDGLEQHVPDLRVQRLSGATHWVVHEQPQLLARHMAEFLTETAA